MSSLKSFIIALAACIGFPTWIMVIRPYADERDRQPVAYQSTKDPNNPTAPPPDPEELKGLYFPSAYSGDRKRGELVYVREGCAQCHTQVIRPAYAGIDQWRRGWGKEQEYKADAPIAVRWTTPWDYLHEDFAMFGLRRIGPDLTNAGYRYAGKLNEFYQHLYSPRSLREWSNSPSFKHLFKTVRKETPAGRDDALKLPANLLPEGDYEIVPTADGKALAEYVLGLKRDAPLPFGITQIKTPPKKE